MTATKIIFVESNNSASYLKQIMSQPDINISIQTAEWLAALDVLKEANLALQRRLADEIRRSEGNKAILEVLESFLDKFLNKDLHISLLRKDVLALQTAASADSSLKQQRLQHEVNRMIEEFQMLKIEFEDQFCAPANS
jgi:hypothetical protein